VLYMGRGSTHWLAPVHINCTSVWYRFSQSHLVARSCNRSL